MLNRRKVTLTILFAAALGAVVVSAPTQVAIAADSGGITEDNVFQKVGEASSKADHQALADYFRSAAAAKAESVARHEEMFHSWRNVQGKPKEHMRAHCQTLLGTYAAEQKALAALAAEHEKLAK